MAFIIDGTTGIATVDGTVSAPSQRGQDNNSGISYASDTIRFSTNGVERFAISNTGLSGDGSGLSGIGGGITMAQAYILNSDFSGNADPVQGWTKYTNGNAGNLGASDMSESSGIWTFPSPGFYMIETQAYHYGSGSNSSTTMYPQFSVNSGTSFQAGNHSYTNIPNLSGTWYNTSYNKHFFDVTNVSTHKAKVVTSGNTQIIHNGGTFVRFIRLADT